MIYSKKFSLFGSLINYLFHLSPVQTINQAQSLVKQIPNQSQIIY